jgi:hypothetical protein
MVAVPPRTDAEPPRKVGHGASAPAAASSPVCTPGVLIEVTATSMPVSSRNDSALARD